MEFCGRCGKEFGRGLERGRFCAKCGHESPGNARYPLWDPSAELREGARVAAGAATATAVALPSIEHSDDDATRVRMPSIPVMSPAVASGEREPGPVSAWRMTLLASLATIAVVLVLGFLLLLR